MPFKLCAVCLIESCLLSLGQTLIFQIHLMGLAVIENMLFQDIDLLNPGILFPDGSKQAVCTVHSGMHRFFQFLIAVDVVFL